MDRLEELMRQWEAEDPDSVDVDQPPESPMELPEMDFTDGPPAELDTAEASPMAAASVAPESVRTDSESASAPTRLRTPAPSAAAAPQRKPPASLDWKEMGDRLAMAELGRGQSRAYEGMFANIGAQSGYRPNAHAGEAAHNVAQQPLALAKERQNFEAKERDAGVKNAMRDPNSLQSQKARESVKTFFGETPLPPGFDDWSAEDVQKFASSGTLAQVGNRRRADEAAKLKAQADADKATKGEADLQNARKNWRKDLMDAGIDPDTATREDIKLAMSKRHAVATEKVAASNNAIAVSNKRDKDEDRDSLRETIPFAGGELKYTGKGTPREDDRKKAQDVAASWNAALSGMDVLEKSLGAYAAHPGAETKRDVDSKVRVVSSALNSAVGGGAMSQDEAVAMSQALGADLLSPSGVEAFIRSVAGDDPGAAKALTTRLKSVRESAKASATGKLKSYRYEMDGGGASSGPVKMRFPDGSVHSVSPDKIEKARTKGGVQVDG